MVTAGLTLALAGGALAVPAVAAGAAAHAPTRADVVFVGGIVARRKHPPSVAIEGTTAVFDPTSVRAKPVGQEKCSTKKYSFAIGNLTSSDQQVELTAAQGGGDFGPAVPPQEALAVCIAKKGDDGPVFTLESNTATTLGLDVK